MGQYLARTGQMVPVRSKEGLVRYKAAMKPRSLETQRGCWDELVYTLPLGVDTNTTIKLELGYMVGMALFPKSMRFEWN